MTRSGAVAALLAVVLAAAPSAQHDRITWRDGTATADCRVLEYTVFELKFEVRGARESRSADRVQALELERAKAAFANRTAPAALLEEADRRLAAGDALVGQLGVIAAARRLLETGGSGEAFARLASLVTALPQCGSVPLAYELRLEHLLSLGTERLEEFARLAQKFASSASTGGWPAGFALTASYYEALAQHLQGQLDAQALQNRMRVVLDKTQGQFPALARRAELQIACALARAGSHDDAAARFEALLERDDLEPDVRIQCWLALGRQALAGAAADPARARVAMLRFLRAWLEAPAASAEYRAEAAHSAAAAAALWGGDEWRAIEARMRAHLRRDLGHTSWARR